MSVVETAEDVFSALGLFSPTKRFMFGFALAESLVLLSKPSWAVNSSGDFRPWSVMNSSRHATLMPWWMPGLITGTVFALFI